MSLACSLIIITPIIDIGKSQGKREGQERKYVGKQRKTKEKKKKALIYSLGIDERLIANFLEKLKMCGLLFEL